MVEESTIAEAQSPENVPVRVGGATAQEPLQQHKANKPARNLSLLGALLGLIGALASAGIPLWLFHVRWPVEREQMLAESMKIVEETAQTKLSQELTKAQAQQSKIEAELARLDALIKEVEHRYAEPLKKLQLQTAEQQGKLVELQRIQAYIKNKTLSAREESAVTRETVDAANAITAAIQSVRPNMDIDCTVGLIKANVHNRYAQSPPINKVLISSTVTNKGAYPVVLSISIEAFDENGAGIPVTFWVDGQVTPSGTVNASQTVAGSTTLVFPEDWVRSRPGTIQIATSYKSITSYDVLDSLAGQIHIPQIRERLENAATFTSQIWAKLVFN